MSSIKSLVSTPFTREFMLALSIVLALSLFFAGCNYADKDFDLAGQANLDDSGSSEDDTSTDDGTSDDEDSDSDPDSDDDSSDDSDDSDDEADEEDSDDDGSDDTDDSDDEDDSELLDALATLAAVTESNTKQALSARENWFANYDGQKKIDSDGDGVFDFREEMEGSDINDAGSRVQALSLSGERRNLDDPQLKDSDIDGLTDLREATLNTNPLLSDTDGDKVADGTEVEKAGTNPLNAKDFPAATGDDADGDGIPDLVEQQDGTNPNSNDSDGDGLSDAAEFAFGTDPNDIDTDKDGIKDGAELKYNNNPLRYDAPGEGPILDIPNIG